MPTRALKDLTNTPTRYSLGTNPGDGSASKRARVASTATTLDEISVDDEENRESQVRLLKARINNLTRECAKKQARVDALENEQRSARREMSLLRSQLATVEVVSNAARRGGDLLSRTPVYPHPSPPVAGSALGSFDNARVLLEEVNRAREQAKLHVRRWQARSTVNWSNGSQSSVQSSPLLSDVDRSDVGSPLSQGSDQDVSPASRLLGPSPNLATLLGHTSMIERYAPGISWRPASEPTAPPIAELSPLLELQMEPSVAQEDMGEDLEEVDEALMALIDSVEETLTDEEKSVADAEEFLRNMDGMFLTDDISQRQAQPPPAREAGEAAAVASGNGPTPQQKAGLAQFWERCKTYLKKKPRNAPPARAAAGATASANGGTTCKRDVEGVALTMSEVRAMEAMFKAALESKNENIQALQAQLMGLGLE